MNNKNIVIAIVAVIIVILLVGAFLYKNSITNINIEPVGIDRPDTVTNPGINMPPNFSQPTTTTTSIPQTITVRIALLAMPSKDNERPQYGCDMVVMVNRDVPYTVATLDAAMKELFAKREPWPYTETRPGNFITSQKNLFYQKSVIENGVAKIYLTGSVGPFGGVCDDPRLKIQIEQTTLQFQIVKTVETYINNQKI
jgi:hypothetical protein